MRLKDIYDLAIKKGLAKDPRTKKELRDEMNSMRRVYRGLSSLDRRFFDKEKLKHPFADTRILYGDRTKTIRTLMVGIDMGAEELLTAYLLNEKSACIDLAMSHHPAGKALSNLHHVMRVQTNILSKLGIKPDIAKSFMDERIDEVSRSVLPRNHERYVDIARLLDIPFMCVHTPADNCVANFLQKLFDREKPSRVRDVLKLLKSIPEYQDAMYSDTGPRIIAGKDDKKAGKVFVDMTGGTEGSKKIFGRLSQAGVGTIVAMHLDEAHFKMAKAEFLNVIIAGHIASDNLGLNILLDELVKIEDLNIVPCSGFVRVKR
ncbi:MAG: NGG1p interacting factor NIF3 [Candidatus Omnitrophota bacterium]